MNSIVHKNFIKASNFKPNNEGSFLMKIAKSLTLFMTTNRVGFFFRKKSPEFCRAKSQLIFFLNHPFRLANMVMVTMFKNINFPKHLKATKHFNVYYL